MSKNDLWYILFSCVHIILNIYISYLSIRCFQQCSNTQKSVFITEQSPEIKSCRVSVTLLRTFTSVRHVSTGALNRQTKRWGPQRCRWGEALTHCWIQHTGPLMMHRPSSCSSCFRSPSKRVNLRGNRRCTQLSVSQASCWWIRGVLDPSVTLLLFLLFLTSSQINSPSCLRHWVSVKLRSILHEVLRLHTDITAAVCLEPLEACSDYKCSAHPWWDALLMGQTSAPAAAAVL